MFFSRFKPTKKVFFVGLGNFPKVQTYEKSFFVGFDRDVTYEKIKYFAGNRFYKCGFRFEEHEIPSGGACGGPMLVFLFRNMFMFNQESPFSVWRHLRRANVTFSVIFFMLS